MEKCKFCEAELEENSTVCPVCGKDNAEETEPAEVIAAEEEAEVLESEDKTETAVETEAKSEKTKKPASKLEIAILVVLICVLAALAGLLISQRSGKKEAPVEEIPETTQIEYTVPADGNPDDITCKGSYTVSDAELISNQDVVVATCGGEELTLSQLQIYYWSQVRSFFATYGAYLSYFGVDTEVGLDVQPCAIEEGRTWQQFFLESALNYWQNDRAMANEAKLLGVELKEEYSAILDRLDGDLESAAQSSGFNSVPEMLAHDLGAIVTAEDYRAYVQMSCEGRSFYNGWLAENEPTDEEIAAYFAENEASFADNGITKDTCTVDVRHILIMPEAGQDGTISEEAWAKAEQAAQEVYDKWLADGTEEGFAAMAGEYTQDPGSQSTGGLYTGVNEGEMVPAFNDWCFDAQRKTGDHGIVKTEYGYHVMYFVGRTLVWETSAADALTDERCVAFENEIFGKYPMTVQYAKLMLGDLPLVR